MDVQIKTTEQFNGKYKDYLEKGHYGQAVDNQDFTKWLDEKFQTYITQPGFSYAQVKAKFGQGRFYAEGITNEQRSEVENKITETCKRLKDE